MRMQVTENRGTGIKPDTRNAIWENARRREAASDEQKIVNKAAFATNQALAPPRHRKRRFGFRNYFGGEPPKSIWKKGGCVRARRKIWETLGLSSTKNRSGVRKWMNWRYSSSIWAYRSQNLDRLRSYEGDYWQSYEEMPIIDEKEGGRKNGEKKNRKK